MTVPAFTRTAEKGSTVALKWTVKEHYEFRGQKETSLTRCRVSVTEEAA